MHQDGLASASLPRVRNANCTVEVVEQDACAGLERHHVRQREHPLGGQRHDFGHAAGQHGQARHAIAGADMGIGRGATHHARDLGTRGERQVRLVLVEPTGQQGVREGDAGRVDVDHHGVVEVGSATSSHPHSVGSVEPGDLVLHASGSPSGGVASQL